MSNWKNFERKIAKNLGTQRKSKSFLGGSVSDIVKTLKPKKDEVRFEIEVKYRNKLPSYLLDMVAQAIRNSNDGFPIVILKQKGQHSDNSLVFTRYDYFFSLFEEGNDNE